jgi:hypothetical protein
MNKLISATLLISLWNCSNERVITRIEEGQANVVVNTYFDAYKKKNFEDQFTFTSKIDFKDKIAIETLLEIGDQFYITKDSFASIETDNFIEKDSYFKPIKEKPVGLSFQEIGVGEDELESVKDTLMNDNEYLLVTYKNPIEIKKFQIKLTDTVYDFSFSKFIENKFKGRIENVQVYNKREDIFMTIYIDYSRSIDQYEEEIIDFNKFVQNDK